MVWDSGGGDVLVTPDPEGHSDHVLSVSWYGSRACTCGHDRTVRVWNTNTGACLKTFVGHTDSVWCVAWTKDGSAIVSGGGSNDPTVRVWNTNTGACLSTFEGHESGVSAVVCLPATTSKHI